MATRRKIANLTQELYLAGGAVGIAIAEVGEGLWEQSPAKVIIAVAVGILGGWLVRRAEDDILSTR